MRFLEWLSIREIEQILVYKKSKSPSLKRWHLELTSMKWIGNRLQQIKKKKKRHSYLWSNIKCLNLNGIFFRLDHLIGSKTNLNTAFKLKSTRIDYASNKWFWIINIIKIKKSMCMQKLAITTTKMFMWTL